MTTIPIVHVEGVPDPVPPGLSVLDVREPTEWEHGHIDGAQHIPLGEPWRLRRRGARGQVPPWCAASAAARPRPWTGLASRATTR